MSERAESIQRVREALTKVLTGKKAQILPRDVTAVLEALDEAVKLLREIDGGAMPECRITPDHSSRGYKRRSCLEHDVEAPEGICVYSTVKKFLEEFK